MRRAAPSPTSDLPGARESNAGDEFHILWGVSLCLQMVRSDSSLQRVLIEDVSPVDRVGASRRAFLAADITEYYEGEHFDDATKVVMSQLKYSHRNPSKPWTAAELAPSGKAREKTILGKLVDAYREYMKQHHRDEVLTDRVNDVLAGLTSIEQTLLVSIDHCLIGTGRSLAIGLPAPLKKVFLRDRFSALALKRDEPVVEGDDSC